MPYSNANDFLFTFMGLRPKPSLKIKTANAFFCILVVQLKKIFFRNKIFLFFKIESWIFQYLFEIKFRETSQNFNSFSLFTQFLFSFFFMSCLIKFKLCEVSPILIVSTFYLEKKVLFLNEIFFKPLSISKQKSFFYLFNFQRRFWLRLCTQNEHIMTWGNNHFMSAAPA